MDNGTTILINSAGTILDVETCVSPETYNKQAHRIVKEFFNLGNHGVANRYLELNPGVSRSALEPSLGRPYHPSAAERAEIRDLRRELERVTRERDILGKASLPGGGQWWSMRGWSGCS